MIRWVLALVALVLAVPVAAVLGSWFSLDDAALDTLKHLAQTVAPGYAGQSLALALMVAIGVTLVGAGAAALVTLFDFRGRAQLEWMLLLPLAMPPYVLAYAYTDLLQFSGPLQTALRAQLGGGGAGGSVGALWPDVRSLPGAGVMFVLCLYPYVYLITRTALAERGVQMMEAARMLGAGLTRRVMEIALPLARPAMAAGVSLALMETLADFGVGSYFGLSTFSTGIYKAWLSMNDPEAAAMLASMLLVFVGALLALERHAQRKLRFAGSRPSAQVVDAQPTKLRGAAQGLAIALCALPVLLGFVVPVAALIRLVWLEVLQSDDVGLGVSSLKFAQWSFNSVVYASVAAVLAAGLAVALAFAARTALPKHAVPTRLGSLVGLGYAVPGAVLAVGILLPLGWLQRQAPSLPWTALITGTSMGVMLAYLSRFTAVALQTVQSGYARVPSSIDETARTLGARPARILATLHAPLLKRSVAVAMLLVFVDVMKELPATLVLRPFNSDTLAVVAYNFARDERLAQAALPSLAIVAVGLLPVIWLSRRART
jgi:iron(III) transport system permease protein